MLVRLFLFSVYVFAFAILVILLSWCVRDGITYNDRKSSWRRSKAFVVAVTREMICIVRCHRSIAFAATNIPKYRLQSLSSFNAFEQTTFGKCSEKFGATEGDVRTETGMRSKRRNIYIRYSTIFSAKWLDLIFTKLFSPEFPKNSEASETATARVN